MLGVTDGYKILSITMHAMTWFLIDDEMTFISAGFIFLNKSKKADSGEEC